MGKLKLIDNNELFSRSKCECSFCTSMHNSDRDWESFVVKTNLQKRMKMVIKKIEKKQRKNAI